MDADTAFFLPDNLVTHVPAIDEQHADLFAQLAHLKQICLESNTLPSAEANTLLRSLGVHWDTEAQLAQQAGLDFTGHALKHDKVLKGIAKAFDEVQEGRTDVFGLIRFIEYWFERHILEEDRELAVQLQDGAEVPSFFGDLAERSPHQTASLLN